MDEDVGTTAPDTWGYMDCKARQPYTVEPFPNGNTGWRCTVCGHILRLMPGKYTSGLEEPTNDHII
jgi:hypothetical protein